MKCWKCTRPAVVHLTDITVRADGTKHAVETHLCLEHAIEAHLIAASPASPAHGHAKPAPAAPQAESAGATAAPAAAPKGLSVIRKEPAQPTPEGRACPVCGMTWQQFKQIGLTGCPHDYTVFEARLLPMVKRAQENATQHIGKVPAKLRTSDPVRRITEARLRRELQQALAVENYEHAARVRDQLKRHESEPAPPS